MFVEVNFDISSLTLHSDTCAEDKTLPAAYWFENSATLSISVSLKQSILLNPVPEYVPHDHGEYNRLVMKAP